jgi:hypothetical protein
MWIFGSNSFLSIVDKGDPSGKTLLVRGRKDGDIERLFPDAVVQVGGGTDYLFRARINREEVALRIADAVREVNYPNFKSSVYENDRHDAYMGVWESMYGFQNRGKK